MSYADPQSITINGTATSLPRTGSGVASGEFTSADGTVKMNVGSQYGKRIRRTIRISQSKVSADALIPSQNVRNQMSCYLVVDVPQNGFTVAEQKYLVDALSAYLSASSGAAVSKLLGGEN